MSECQKFAGTEMNRHSSETLATQCKYLHKTLPQSPIPNSDSIFKQKHVLIKYLTQPQSCNASLLWPTAIKELATPNILLNLLCAPPLGTFLNSSKSFSWRVVDVA